MLTKWGLGNFKSIYNSDIDLAPLTVLTGINNSGKNSFIQSMLLVAQKVQSQFTERALILNGTLAELGKFEQVLSFDLKKIDKKMKILFELNSENPSFKKLKFEMEFRKAGKHSEKDEKGTAVILKARNDTIQSYISIVGIQKAEVLYSV